MNEDTEAACRICKQEIPQTHNVISNERWRIRHSQETNILGYCVLEPCRHFLDLSEANKDELEDYGFQLSALMKAQREILHCERVYTFSLAEAVPHFHLHVIPRSKDFSRAYKGRGIMSYPTEPNCDAALVENFVQVLQNKLCRILSKLGD